MNFDYSNEALFHPERREPFLTDGSLPTFDASASSVSFENGWWMSNLAHLAYFNRPDVSSHLDAVGMHLVEMFDHEGTQAFVAEATDFAVLSFRGTETDDFTDALRNAQFLWDDFDTGGQVHVGFHKALDAVWARVEAALSEVGGRPLWYTGHSLGAALATLAAARERPFALTTFGSPRVGNADFVMTMDGLPVHRYVNCADVVTTVPPGIFGYQHVGTHLFLRESHAVVTEPSESHVGSQRASAIIRYGLRLPWFRPGEVKFRTLLDHSIVNYSACLWQAIQ